MSDDKSKSGLGTANMGGAALPLAGDNGGAGFAPAEKGKPVARLSLTIDFAAPVEKADVAQIVSDLKTKGDVTKADFKVLRAYKQELA